METYKYKDVLLALRKEYLELNEKLDKLREFCFVYGKGDYYFSLYLEAYSKMLPQLTINKIIKEYDPRTIGSLLNRLFSDNTTNRCFMVKDSNGNYVVDRDINILKVKDSDFLVSPAPKQQGEFNELVDEILICSSARNLPFSHTIKSINNGESKLIPKSYGISLVTPEHTFEYKGREDEFKISSFIKTKNDKAVVTFEHLEQINNLEFPAQEFSDYHKDLIEKHNSCENDEKFITFGLDYNPDIYGRFSFEKYNDGLLLWRKK